MERVLQKMKTLRCVKRLCKLETWVKAGPFRQRHDIGYWMPALLTGEAVPISARYVTLATRIPVIQLRSVNQ